MRRVAWAGAAALVVLSTRTLVYALNPSPLALHFEAQAGGPAFPIVVLVSLAVGLALACAVLWTASLGVRERRLLEARPLAREPELRLASVALRALVLFVVTAVAFDLVESTIHWYAGLGWHGIHCLIGPVHRDAIPILASLSVLAVAVHGAVEHLLGWARRLFAQLAARVFTAPGQVSAAIASDLSPRRRPPAVGGARGPPVAAAPVL